METLTLSGALSAAQTAIEAAAAQSATVAQNIANVATPGYARQQVDLVELPGASGVAATQIQRLVSDVARDALVAATGGQSGATTQSQLLSQVQALFGEPSNGLSGLLTGFWNAWQQVANNPTDPGARQALVSQAQQVASKFQSIAQGVANLQAATAAAVTQQVAQVNSLAQQVASLNTQIQSGQAAGQDVNALMDQRDQLVQQLAQVAGVQWAQPATAQPTLVIGGQPLVVGGQVYTLSVSSGSSPAITWTATGQTVPVSGGQVGGEMTVLNQSLPAVMSGLNGVVADLTAAVNTQHAAGYTPTQPAQAGGAFFTGTTAATIAVNPQIVSNPNLVAASASGAPADGSNAQTIANLAAALAAGGGTKTIVAEYNAVVVSLASGLQSAQQSQQSLQAQVNQLQQLDQSTAGVSLTEEQTNLLLDQQQSQAASSVLTAIKAMLESLIAAV
ncbi:MAG: flagellar hook-associated protein FlgK [bacterium]